MTCCSTFNLLITVKLNQKLTCHLLFSKHCIFFITVFQVVAFISRRSPTFTVGVITSDVKQCVQALFVHRLFKNCAAHALSALLWNSRGIKGKGKVFFNSFSSNTQTTQTTADSGQKTVCLADTVTAGTSTNTETPLRYGGGTGPLL